MIKNNKTIVTGLKVTDVVTQNHKHRSTDTQIY